MQDLEMVVKVTPFFQLIPISSDGLPDLKGPLHHIIPPFEPPQLGKIQQIQLISPLHPAALPYINPIGF